MKMVLNFGDDKMLENEFIIKGDQCFKDEKYEDAITFQNIAVNNEIIQPFLFYKIARSYFRIKSFDESIIYADKAIAIDNKLSKAYYLKGLCYYYQGNVSQCVKYLQKALNFCSNDIKLIYKICKIKILKKLPKYEGYVNNIIRILNNKFKNDRDNVEILYYIGKIFKLLKKYDSAYKIFLCFQKLCSAKNINNKFTQEINEFIEIINKNKINESKQPKNNLRLQKPKKIDKNKKKNLNLYCSGPKYKGPSVYRDTVFELYPYKK